MAGKIIIDTIDTDNAFITLNVQQSLIATMNVSGIYSNTGVKMIGANGTVSNTAITGLVTAAQIATVANTQITGNITSSQITSNPTFYGNVSVTGAIGVGNATPAASGSGITFPATQSASTDANTLDDYEEGTWTPTDNSGASLSITFNNPTYTKIGRLVFVRCSTIVYPATASGLGASIGGLPFTNGSADSSSSAIVSGSASANRCLVQASAVTIAFYATSTLGGSTNVSLSSQTIYGFSAVYTI